MQYHSSLCSTYFIFQVRKDQIPLIYFDFKEKQTEKKIAPGSTKVTRLLDEISSGWDIKTLKKGVYNGNADRLLTIASLL